MIKSDLIRRIAEHASLSLTQAAKALDGAILEITQTDKTTLKGFGTFEWKTRKARTSRNPRTGESIEVPQCQTLRFKPSAALKEL